MTQDIRDVLKLALKALEANDQLINGTGTKGGLVYCMDGYYSGCFDVDPINKQTEEAITAIKEALAQRTEQNFCSRCGKRTKDIHTCTPPHCTFVGLTDDEIAQGCKESWVTEQAFQSAVWWAEEKLKEKNT
jgi:hypothetical protein